MKKVKKKDLLKTIKMLGKINYDLARSDILEIERLNEIIENIKTAHDNVVRATQENEIILTDFMIEKIKTNSFCHTFENGIEVRFFYKKNIEYSFRL